MNDYAYGYCGMPCALCTRYRTEGKSRCPGCSHDGYYTEGCKVHGCCREKGLEQCGQCGEFVCARLGKMGEFSDLTTDNVKMRISRRIAEKGFDEWYAEYVERAELLTEALEHYNNGRMKRYICEHFIRYGIAPLREIMERARLLNGTPKENGKPFREIAEAVLSETEK